MYVPITSLSLVTCMSFGFSSCTNVSALANVALPVMIDAQYDSAASWSVSLVIA